MFGSVAMFFCMMLHEMQRNSVTGEMGQRFNTTSWKCSGRTEENHR